MNSLKRTLPGLLYLIFQLCVSTKSFPADESTTQHPVTKASTPDAEEATFTLPSSLKEPQPINSSSVSTTSSLLFKDKKPILTYLLGQPKKQGGVSSPAQLLSPDRYEFFTFDDDGQIVKKLMSVKEIQKIIANNEKGTTEDHGTPIEYYQILTVTPDVESIPSVSRINPNEPLFSIHDVIASVQNVLKSEMKIKQSQSSSSLNNTNFIASASSDHFEILTEQPPFTFRVELQKTTPTSQHPTTPPTTFTLKQSLDPQVTTKQPEKDSVTTLQDNVATLSSSPPHQPASEPAITHIPVQLVSSPPATQRPVSPPLKEHAGAASTYKVVNDGAPVLDSKPLSLSDAHPGFLSNDTFLDMKPITLLQTSHVAEPVVQELKSAPSGNFVKVEMVERNPTPANQPETSTAKVEIPITPDLADSVSSVLWQIASENSMMGGLNAPTEAAAASTHSPTASPQGTDGTELKTTSPTPTTEVPAQSRSTVEVEKLSESPLVALGNILIPQNRPRPFQKIPLIEKGTPEVAESRIDPFPSSTATYDLHSSPSSTVVILTEEATSPASEPSEEKLSSSKGPEDASTPAPQNPVISVSPDAVVQSPEHVKPVTEKVAVVNTTTQNQTIAGVQVIQEANIGQIPRTTEFPGQVVKEIQRMELVDSGATEEILADSPSNTISTQLPYTGPEVTTVSEQDAEERAENLTEKEAAYTEANTEVSPEQTESKNDDDQQSADRVDIAFVPMVIKTPSVFKQENLQKVESQTEVDENATTTETPEEKYTEQTQVTDYVTETSQTNEQDRFESKELPETTFDFKSAPASTTEIIQKEAVQADALITDSESLSSFKQNVPTKPHFGKPQKPAYVKPTKAKPQTDIKSPTKPFLRPPQKESDTKRPYENHLQSSPSVLELDAAPDENLGLEATVANLDADVKRFADLCNELAFSLWSSVTHNGLSFVRSLVVSPFAVTSLLAMVFLGARGPTSGQMNDVLKLDDMVTFNPHLVFRNVTESLVISRNPGVATAAFVRELYSDKSKGKLLDFYKERVQQFYDGHVEEVNFKTVGDTLRRQTNHLVKRQTWGKITDFLRGSTLTPRPPLAAFSANIFQTDCTWASTRDRDGEMYFVILPASRLRRLVPIPAVVWRDSFLAGYEPNLDATAVSISPSDSAISTIFVLPGQQGLIAPGDTLARLEHHLLGSPFKKGHWSRLMRCLLPRPGLELQIPRLSHKSVINVTASLQRMGLKDLFSADKADLTGLNGLANDLHLSDMLQVNLFSTCGEEPIGARHHSEVYPATPNLRREKSADNIFSDSVDNLFAISDFEDPAISALPLELRPRQARVPLSSPGVRVPEPPRLRFDRPFLFFVRHNPTGLILHMGRFNPRLMP